jgi:hypothetical protein
MLMTRGKVAAVVFLAVGVAVGGAALYGRGTPAGVSPGSGGGGGPEPAARVADRVPATVNGEAILAEEVYAAAYLALPNGRDLAAPERARRISAIWRETLDRVVEYEVVWQDATATLKARNPAALEFLQEAASREFSRRWAQAAKRSAGLKDDEELNASLRGQGTSLQAVRRQWERAFVAEAYLRSRVSRAREAGPPPDQEKQRIVAQLMRQAVIEYAGGQ